MQHLGFTRLGNPQGKPLALLHGWGCDANFLRPIAELFPERDIFLIDLPGYGKSACLSPFTEDLASTIYLLINTLPDNSDVMSWSFGTLYMLRALSIINNPCLNITSYSYNVTHSEKMQAFMQQKQNQLPLRPHRQRPFSHHDCLHKKQHNCVYENDVFPEVESNPNSPESCQICRIRCHERMPHIESLITICGSPRFPADPNWPGLSSLRMMKLNTQMNSHRLKLILHMFYHMQINCHSARPESCLFIKEHIKNSQPVADNVLINGIKQVSYMDERTTLSHLHIPSLHLFGAHDHLVPYSTAHYLRHDSRHYSYIFAHSSHTPYLTEPERFETVVRAFYERNEQITKPIPFMPD